MPQPTRRILASGANVTVFDTDVVENYVAARDYVGLQQYLIENDDGLPEISPWYLAMVLWVCKLTTVNVVAGAGNVLVVHDVDVSRAKNELYEAISDDDYKDALQYAWLLMPQDGPIAALAAAAPELGAVAELDDDEAALAVACRAAISARAASRSRLATASCARSSITALALSSRGAGGGARGGGGAAVAPAIDGAAARSTDAARAGDRIALAARTREVPSWRSDAMVRGVRPGARESAFGLRGRFEGGAAHLLRVTVGAGHATSSASRRLAVAALLAAQSAQALRAHCARLALGRERASCARQAARCRERGERVLSVTPARRRETALVARAEAASREGEIALQRTRL